MRIPAEHSSIPISKLLAIDIGNTNVRLGLFDGNHIEAHWSLKTDTSREGDDYGAALMVLFQRQGVEPDSISAAVLGSVVPPLTPVFEGLLRDYCSVSALVVKTGTRTGVRLMYDPPFELGADRIAHAVAVERLHRTPAIVVDFGTATTFDAIGEGGTYLGGAISPGLAIAAEALWQRTSQLHKSNLEFPERAIGRNTVEAVQSGLLFGQVGMIKEMIARFRCEMAGHVSVIATGRLAGLIAPHVTEIEGIDYDLSLQGLRLIYARNAVQMTR